MTVHRSISRLTLCGALCASYGCSGVQGGTEGSETGPCVYDEVVLDDPDEVPAGFTAAPRTLFAPMWDELMGTLQGREVRLKLTPDFSGLTALYDQEAHPDCGPHLSVGASAALTIESGTTEPSIGMAGAEVRFGFLLAAARFDVSPSSPLEALRPTGDAPPTGDVALQVWLTDVALDEVHSEWRWSWPIDCDGVQLCSGYAEESWGTPKLHR